MLWGVRVDVTIRLILFRDLTTVTEFWPVHCSQSLQQVGLYRTLKDHVTAFRLPVIIRCMRIQFKPHSVMYPIATASLKYSAFCASHKHAICVCTSFYPSRTGYLGVRSHQRRLTAWTTFRERAFSSTRTRPGTYPTACAHPWYCWS